MRKVINYMGLVLLAMVLINLSNTLYSQTTDQQLAQHYYSNEEYDKALLYYERLYETDHSKFFFKRYVECLQFTGDVKNAEKVLKKGIKENPSDREFKVLLASFYDDQGEQAKADEIYSELVEDLGSNPTDIINLYNSFKAQGKSEWSLRALEKGRKLLKKSYPFNFQFAEYYGAMGETEKMMGEYLDLLDYHPTYITSLQRILSNRINFEDDSSVEYEILKVALLDRTQKDPSNETYSQMLTWLFVQKQNFKAALVQVKALDKRNNGRGRSVYELGNICRENKDYKTARDAYQYVIDLGDDSPYYVSAYHAQLNVRFLEVTNERNYSGEDLRAAIGDFDAALEKFGKKAMTVNLIRELAHIKAFYAGEANSAINDLTDALEIPGTTSMQKAEIKMLLADIHVLHGDIWEASLLYMQIDNDFKYEDIGHLAKFKNARIFYYDGEFDFAQAQLDVLKQSTTQLISNDAIKLSILITDNFGLDSNYQAMYWFAQGDLLVEQHEYDRAYQYFDSILTTYPAHSLGDDILLKKAYSLELRGQWNEAISTLEELLKYHSGDILEDDALYELGIIYEEHLMNEDKAAEYYKDILFNHKGSLYTDDVRKRFQNIRGTKSELN